MSTSQVLMRDVYPDLYGLGENVNRRVITVKSFSDLENIFGTQKACNIIKNNIEKGNITEQQAQVYFGELGELGHIFSPRLPSFNTTINSQKISFSGGKLYNVVIRAFMTKITGSTSKSEHEKKIYESKSIHAINNSDLTEKGKTMWLNAVGNYLGPSKIAGFMSGVKSIMGKPFELVGGVARGALIGIPVLIIGVLGAALLAINMITKTNIQTPYGGIQGRK